MIYLPLRCLLIMFNAEVSLRINQDMDVVTVRQKAIWFAKQAGFSESWATLVSTITSGLARDILNNRKEGWIFIDSVHKGSKYGIAITAIKKEIEKRIKAPPNINYSSNSSKVDFNALILKQLIDEFDLKMMNDEETSVKLVKWLN